MRGPLRQRAFATAVVVFEAANRLNQIHFIRQRCRTIAAVWPAFEWHHYRPLAVGLLSRMVVVIVRIAVPIVVGPQLVYQSTSGRLI